MPIPATSSAPPSPTAARRWPVRSHTPAPARWAGRGRYSPSWGCARRRAPRRSLRWSSPSSPAVCRGRPAVATDPGPIQVEAPAKLNLCLFLGPRRTDGLHALCSLFEPLALADALEVSGAGRDEVVCPRVEGENLATRALAALRESGWDGPPLRVEIEKRIPVAAGLGGNRDPLLDLDSQRRPVPAALAQRCQRPGGEVLALDPRADDFVAAGPGDLERVGQGERLEQRAERVQAVGPARAEEEAEVELGGRLDLYRARISRHRRPSTAYRGRYSPSWG